MSDAYSACCAARLIEQYEEVEGNHGRVSNRFHHYSCGNCGQTTTEIIYPVDVIRHVLATMSVSERQLIARKR